MNIYQAVERAMMFVFSLVFLVSVILLAYVAGPTPL